MTKDKMHEKLPPKRQRWIDSEEGRAFEESMLNIHPLKHLPPKEQARIAAEFPVPKHLQYEYPKYSLLKGNIIRTSVGPHDILVAHIWRRGAWIQGGDLVEAEFHGKPLSKDQVTKILGRKATQA